MTSKTQQDKKNNRKYTLGYLPRVLFFNAFQLGAENMHISSIIKWRRINSISSSKNRVKRWLLSLSREVFHTSLQWKLISDYSIPHINDGTCSSKKKFS